MNGERRDKHPFVLHLSSFVIGSLPIILAAIVLWTGYSASAHRRYEAQNGITGQILAGGSFGQTFVARYDGLSSIEVRIATYGRQADLQRATLVMHLRPGPDSNQDVASVSLPPSVVLEENGWYRFSFPAITGSRGHTYYVEIDSPDGTVDNSLALFWFKPNPLGDPYRDGAAYRDGRLTKADLPFGVGYSASPVNVWKGMLGSASVNSSSVVLGFLLVVATLGIGWSLVYLPRILRGPGLRRRWLIRWSLPFALAVAFVYGLLFMLIMPPWQGPDEYSHFGYAVLLDTHNLDDRQVEALDLDNKDRDHALIEAVNASADRHDFTRLFLGSVAPGAPTEVGRTIFQQNRQPATYYLLCALGLRVARALGAPADPYTNPEAALMAMRAVSLLLGLVVVALAWLAGALLSRAGDPWLMLLLPITVALLPMHTFMATVVNNDVLAEVAVSALFVSLVALLRWPGGLRGWSLAAFSTALTFATIASKSTATVAALPLLTGGLLIWIGTLVFRRWRAKGRSLRAATALCLLLSAFSLLVAVLLGFEHQDSRAAGWFTSLNPIQRVDRVRSNTAHEGSYVVQLDEAGGHSALQDVVPPVFHPALDVEFSGWARLSPGQLITSTQVVTAQVAIMEGERVAGTITATLEPNAAWVRLSTEGKISASAERVRLVLAATGGQANVQFDDMSLDARGTVVSWNDPIYRPLLVNPSAEDSPTVLRDVVNRLVPAEVRGMADVLANPQPFNKGALWRDYAYYQYRSFWGSFGWLSIYLPSLFYTLLDILILLALVGLAVHAVRAVTAIRRRGWSEWSWLGLVSLLALLVAVIAGFAKQTSLLAYAGQPAYPQGRYLLVLIAPIAWLLLLGLREIRRLIEHQVRRVSLALGTRYSVLGTQAVWLWGNALLFFAVYSLFALVLPFYYG
jgi:hypothetical protein